MNIFTNEFKIKALIAGTQLYCLRPNRSAPILARLPAWHNTRRQSANRKPNHEHHWRRWWVLRIDAAPKADSDRKGIRSKEVPRPVQLRWVRPRHRLVSTATVQQQSTLVEQEVWPCLRRGPKVSRADRETSRLKSQPPTVARTLLTIA